MAIAGIIMIRTSVEGSNKICNFLYRVKNLSEHHNDQEYIDDFQEYIEGLIKIQKPTEKENILNLSEQISAENIFDIDPIAVFAHSDFIIRLNTIDIKSLKLFVLALRKLYPSEVIDTVTIVGVEIENGWCKNY